MVKLQTWNYLSIHNIKRRLINDNYCITKRKSRKNFLSKIIKKKIIKQPILDSRKLKIQISNDIEIILLKSIDVIKFVENGYASIGIVGSDILEESNFDNFIEMLDLNTGICHFALAALPNTSLQDIKIVASKYPIISKKILNDLNLNCRIVKMEGSLELAPLVNYADAIIDIVETGETLRVNGLQIVKLLNKISTKIIVSKNNQDNKRIKEIINLFK